MAGISLTASPVRYALEGRVVTLGQPGVVDDGAIYIADGEIRAVQAAGAPPPPGFETATRIRTTGTIFPGLIELHNHLAYNAIPLWLVPRAYTNNGQWRGTNEYRRNVTAPAGVLAQAQGLVESVVRFVECRSLLGGTTTSQGITLVGTGIQPLFKGLVRNVEAKWTVNDVELPGAGTKIGNPPAKEAEKLSYLANQQAVACYLQHLSEGIDATARGWFLNLQLADQTWAIHRSLCGIHGTALRREDFDLIAGRGGSIVWSPLSNYLLYGQTLDLAAVVASGARVALGSDWGPSGSKSLLGELKVAWLASEQAGGRLTPEQLLRMATINAAEILGWDGVLGTIEPGKRADLIVLRGRTGDPYRRLLEADEAALTLIVIDGIPRVGEPRFMNRFELDNPESIRIAGSERLLNLKEAETHPLLAGLTLTEATERLQDALRRLPDIAGAVDNALLAGLGEGGPGLPISEVRLELEMNDEPLEFLAGSIAEFVFPMELEAITVADDPTYLPKLAAAINLPEFVKQELPGLYGAPVPLPFDTGRDPVMVPGLPARENATVQTLRHFLASWRRFTPDERRRVVDQALLILEQNYVHLPFKRSMYGIDPIQRLRLLRHQLDQSGDRADDSMTTDVDFHAEMTRIFHSLRDLHTSYRLPYPFHGAVAWLPFLVEEYWDDQARPHVIISKIVGISLPKELEGVEIVHWNGVPIETAIAINADRQAGSNPDARRARGINSLTIRPLGRGLPPDEDWVTLSYRDGDQIVREVRMEWLVFLPQLVGSGNRAAGDAIETSAAMGLDDHTDDIQAAKKVLYAAGILKQERQAEAGARIAASGEVLPTSMPTVFRAGVVQTGQGAFGHVRIFTFNVARADEFVEELGTLVEQLKDADGLILDVRGNGGGLIPAAEGALQLFTARRIEPQHAQFRNTPLNLSLCRMNRDDRPDGIRLGRWVASIDEAVQTGSAYSLGFPLTPPEFLRSLSRRYYGPVALITDALCYSAADMFIAGFQDHEIGPVIGVHGNTGAGGANVWSYALLARVWSPDEADRSPYMPLPEGADFRLAMRRSIRVGLNAGGIVEDLGIKPDVRHRMTYRDLMESNADLMDTAARTLRAWQQEHPSINLETAADGSIRLVIGRPGGPATRLSVRLSAEGDGGEPAPLEETTIELVVRGITASGRSYTQYGNLGELLDRFVRHTT